MPSGREKGSEKKSNTRREVSAAVCVAAGARWRGAGIAASQATCEGGGRPGGCPPSPCATAVDHKTDTALSVAQ
eukprot:5788687-Pleurochrysis_carterae.AAC.1